MTHMTKTVSTSKKPRKQHSPEFRSEALKLAERIGVAAAARELSLYESQLYNWRSKQQQQLSSSERENELAAENARPVPPAGGTGRGAGVRMFSWTVLLCDLKLLPISCRTDCTQLQLYTAFVIPPDVNIYMLHEIIQRHT